MAPKDGIQTDWTGHDLYDVDGEKIGAIEDVRYGHGTGDLKWLVIEAGLIGKKKMFVPVLEVKRVDGRLAVPYTKDQVKNSPRVENELVPSDDEKGGICRYYGLEYTPTNLGPKEDCVDK